MTARDLTIDLPHLSIAAREWGPNDGPPVLALHGWLDNSASFDRLAPVLPALHLVALDLAGHGRSQHRHPSVAFHFIDWAPEVLAIADSLGWDRFSLIGHSMGAGISTLVAGTFSDRIQRLVLLEGAGPLAADASRAPKQLASAVEDESRAGKASPRVFPDLDAAVAARMRDSDLDRDAARILVERGTEEFENGIRFTHDPRLRTRSRTRLTENQVLAFLASITCPVLAVRALQGWPFPEEVVAARIATIQNVETVEIEGGHHVHLTHPDRVAPIIDEFMSS
jgi:pimeloyl-ACP methyl ester carboxylesterase